MEENFKLYSQKAISITTFFGGPLAAGILIRENYKSLDKNSLGNKALIISILATIILFAIIFSIPDNIGDKLGNLLPLVYGGAIYFIVERIQGIELKSHKENKRQFESAWKAAGVGALSMVIIFGAAFIAADLTTTAPSYDPTTFDSESYDKGLSSFFEKEETSLAIFNSIDSQTPNNLIYEFKSGLVLWKQNKITIENLDKIENLPPELIKQNNLLGKYCDLRIEQYGFIIKSITQNTDIYDFELNEILEQIEDVIDKLN